MNGLIALWKGDVYLTTGTYSYYVPSLPNWYICNGAQINANFTTPNLVGYIPVGATSTNTVNVSGGTISISEDIPVSNHSHSIDISGSSNVVNTFSLSTASYTNATTYTSATGLQVIISDLDHSHNVVYDTGTTTVSFEYISTTSTNSSYNRLNYVAQHFIIYYTSTFVTLPLFKGMTYHWNGSITLNSSYYRPCDSSGNVYSNWYVCCASNNLLNSNIPSFDDRIAVVLTSGSSSSSDSSSIRDMISVGSHTHTLDVSYVDSTIKTTYNNTTYTTLSSVSVDTYSSILTGDAAGINTIWGIESNHTHTVNYEYSNLNETITTTDTFSNPIFKYINLYYIIYLPS